VRLLQLYLLREMLRLRFWVFTLAAAFAAWMLEL